MKKLSLILIGLLFVPTLFLTSCDRGDDLSDNPNTPVADPAFTVLKNYMVENGYDIPKVIKNSDNEKFVAGAPEADGLDAFLDKYHIVDIRSEADFNTGHIQGAKRVDVGNILAEGEQAKPVLIVCYTGQTACYATALMRMYGYKHTQALKWGMSGWNSSTANKWNGKIGVEPAKNHGNWSYGNEPANLTFKDPFIDSQKTDGAELLKERVEKVLADGFGVATKSATDVLDNPTDYFINNYFSEAHYTGFGHIAGAYRILPLTLENEEYLNLPNPSSTVVPSVEVVTYCYTGQTSAVITACLRVLGYNAYTLTFGMNGLYNTNDFWSDPAIKNQWGADSNPKDLPLAQ